jgi:hypothetical protein
MVLVAAIYSRPSNISVVCHSLDGDYGLQALEEISYYFMLCNVAVFLTKAASGKLFDLFLVSNPNDLGDFNQIAVP